MSHTQIKDALRLERKEQTYPPNRKVVPDDDFSCDCPVCRRQRDRTNRGHFQDRGQYELFDPPPMIRSWSCRPS